jgi:hypothetical protein
MRRYKAASDRPGGAQSRGRNQGQCQDPGNSAARSFYGDRWPGDRRKDKGFGRILRHRNRCGQSAGLAAPRALSSREHLFHPIVFGPTQNISGRRRTEAGFKRLGV